MSRPLALLALAAALALVPPRAAAARPAAPDAAPVPPTLDEVRQGMGIPSHGEDFRGQRDTVGYAVRPDQMAKVWELSALPPAPDSLGPAPASGVVAVLSPHDDYVYAGRVYRRALPLVTARTVVLVGVFHGYRRFGVRDRLVFDRYRAWAAPDGPVPVSPLRRDVVDRLADDDLVMDDAMHDDEYSLEPLVQWLRHARPDVEIVPILVPAASFARLDSLAGDLADALGDAMRGRGLVLGRDVAIAISSDGVHYGADFHHTPFGAGGDRAVARATARDRALLTGPLAGPLTREKADALFATFVDPKHPDDDRVTWCGRFAVPFGMLLLEHLAAAQSQTAVGHPLAYSTSIAAPGLPLRAAGLGVTTPATPRHFVGYPAAAFTFEDAPAH